MVKRCRAADPACDRARPSSVRRVALEVDDRGVRGDRDRSAGLRRVGGPASAVTPDTCRSQAARARSCRTALRLSALRRAALSGVTFPAARRRAPSARESVVPAKPRPVLGAAGRTDSATATGVGAARAIAGAPTRAPSSTAVRNAPCRTGTAARCDSAGTRSPAAAESGRAAAPSCGVVLADALATRCKHERKAGRGKPRGALRTGHFLHRPSRQACPTPHGPASRRRARRATRIAATRADSPASRVRVWTRRAPTRRPGNAFQPAPLGVRRWPRTR